MPSPVTSPVSALALGAVLAGALAAGPLPAGASQINTGGEAGAYHKQLLPGAVARS